MTKHYPYAHTPSKAEPNNVRRLDHEIAWTVHYRASINDIDKTEKVNYADAL